MAKKQSAYLAKIQATMEARESRVRRHARLFELDLVTLALGRMGKRETFFREFNEVLAEVAMEYSQEILDDMKGDPDLWYSKDVMDRELRQYCGSLFVPYDERYRSCMGNAPREARDE